MAYSGLFIMAPMTYNPPMTKALSIKGLHKTYRNGNVALKHVDLDVEEGDFFALLGPNGAGKSTLIGCVTSLVNKTAGNIRVFEHDLETEVLLAKSCIGLVPQEFNFNVWEPCIEILVNQAGYYGIARSLAFERAEYFLNQLGLWEKRLEMARNLSGGMKRRLMIARALIHQPRLLILDEPTAGVDIEIRRSMWEFLQQQNANGTTIILTTHYLEEAESLCRNIAIIDQGEVIENSDMGSLLRSLQKETLIFDLEDRLQSAPDVTGFISRLIDPCTLEVDIEKGIKINEVFSVLSELGIHVSSMRNKANRLEELFMEMVEKSGEAG